MYLNTLHETESVHPFSQTTAIRTSGNSVQRSFGPIAGLLPKLRVLPGSGSTDVRRPVQHVRRAGCVNALLPEHMFPSSSRLSLPCALIVPYPVASTSCSLLHLLLLSMPPHCSLSVCPSVFRLSPIASIMRSFSDYSIPYELHCTDETGPGYLAYCRLILSDVQCCTPELHSWMGGQLLCPVATSGCCCCYCCCFYPPQVVVMEVKFKEAIELRPLLIIIIAHHSLFIVCRTTYAGIGSAWDVAQFVRIIAISQL